MLQRKKSADRKRTNFPREISCTTNFKKDWEKLERSGKHDMHLIKEAILLFLMNDGPLPAEWRDHKLNGTLVDMRECHVKVDLLLFYKLVKKADYEAAIFTNIKTHSEAF